MGGPSEYAVGTPMQIPPQILSCFEIASTKLLALQCSKQLTNPMTGKLFTIPQISTSCRKFNIFWLGHRQPKIHHSKCAKSCRCVFYFFWGGASPGYHNPSSIKPSGCAPTSPRIPARYRPTPLFCGLATSPRWICAIVEGPIHIINNVEATLSNTIGLQVERFLRQNRTLHQQSLTLLRHCCRFWQQCLTKFRPFDKIQ